MRLPTGRSCGTHPKSMIRKGAYPLSEKSRTYKELDHDDDSTKRHHDLAARQFSPVNLARKEGLADGTSPPAHLRMVR